jgi:hypothetical protein
MDDYRENSVKFAMTTRGVWYCSEITVSKDDIMNAMDISSKAMAKANKILGVRNRYRKQKDVEKSG